MFERPDYHHDAEQVIVVQVFLPGLNEADFIEFHELVNSTGGKIVGELTTKRDHPTAKYFIGPGKVDELKIIAQEKKAQLVIFNHELSPAQERNLEKVLECRVLSRTGLILDIFAQRARTFEGKLQVELAQLQHLVTRLVRGWTHLERQRGGIGLRGGPGETQLEVDRRLVRLRIDNIKERLEKVRLQRAQSRRARQRASLLTVAIVGYTNAGKSTLFNSLSDSSVYAADQLFATLDPTLRHIMLPNVGRVIIADTVGFIRDLPHELVAAFRATLEEVVDADLLLHIVDASDERRHDKIMQVNNVLEHIDALDVRCLQVFNKIDLIPDEKPHLDHDETGLPSRVWVSAQTKQGLPLLQEAITECLKQNWVYCGLRITPKQYAIRAKLYELDAVLKEEIDDRGNMLVEIRLPDYEYQALLRI